MRCQKRDPSLDVKGLPFNAAVNHQMNPPNHSSIYTFAVAKIEKAYHTYEM